MIEVTNKNFEELYPEIEASLREASYVSIDNEFSGLKWQERSNESLFDSPDERYSRLCENIKPCIIIQCGITTFRHCREENSFKTKTFTFYLLPSSIPTKNRNFLLQASAVEFLSLYGFDFNKFVYDGISYLDEEEEAELRNEVENGSFLRSIGQYIPIEVSDKVMRRVTEIYEWLTKSKRYEVLEIEASSKLVEYLLHKEIRKQFPNVWTEVDKGRVLVMKMEEDERQALQDEEGKGVLENNLMNHYIGFSKVFRLLRSLKKPIVGHNLFLDLMFMYKQFYKPLPKKFVQFKQNVHSQFPVIYDTKHFCFNLASVVKKEDRWKSTGLGDMYSYFKQEKGRNLVMYSPMVEEPQVKISESLKVHDAGWDSYFTGYIFIKMAHVLAVKNTGIGSEMKSMTYTEIITAAKQFANAVNVIRASVSHVCFDGPDPVSTRPQWLYAKLSGKNKLNVTEIAESLASFGNVDVKAVAPRCALIAIGNHNSARDILKHFQSNEDLYIVPYNRFKHSAAAKFCMWSGMFMAGGALFAWTLRMHFSKK